MSGLTVASLFDGIGGFPLAFERAGANVVATVEIDTAAASIGARHFPNAQQFDDVTKVTGDDLRSAGFVPDRGIVTAGWPCQDFSVAGRRAGLAGARSGLWWEVARILAEARPRWFIGENVPGLLSSVCEPECPGGCMRTHGGAMGSILGSLAELGYGVAYRILDAQHFGVPQQRRRVVIVGHLGAPFGAAAQVLLEPESGGGDSAASESAGSRVTASATEGADPAGRSVAPALVARYAKGTDSDATGALIIEHTHNESGLNAAGRRETRLADRRRIGSGRPPRRSREAVMALTSNGVGTCGADDNQAQAGHLVVVTPTDAEVFEWIESRYGDHMTRHLLDEHRRLLVEPDGEGFLPVDLDKIIQTVQHARACIAAGHEPLQPTTVTGGVTHTLTSEGADASEDGTGRGTPIVTVPAIAATLTAGTSNPGVSAPGRRQEDDHNLVAHETVVRRLTELECERLQGYPDEYTEGQSGSARYRQLGNSIAVPMFEWLARRVVAVGREVTA